MNRNDNEPNKTKLSKALREAKDEEEIDPLLKAHDKHTRNMRHEKSKKLAENQKKYKHREAFCLMQYQCDTCGHRELAWNSRDGVTPFGIGCPSCGNSLTHTNFHEDNPSPNHVPHSGQIVFRNGTVEESIAIVKSRMDYMKDSGFEITNDRLNSRIKDLKNGTDSEFTPGWPMVSRYSVLPSMLDDVTMDFVGPHDDAMSNIIQVIEFLGDAYVECPVCKFDADTLDCKNCNDPIRLFFKSPKGQIIPLIYGDTVSKKIDGYYIR